MGDATDEAISEYLAEMCLELKEIANARGMSMLAFLLDLAKSEAEEIRGEVAPQEDAEILEFPRHLKSA